MADVLVLPSAAPLVHRVAEGDAPVGIGESERASGAEMSESARVRTEPALGHHELEPEPEARGALQDDVVAVHLLFARAGDGLRREHADSVELTVAGSAE